MSRLTVVFWLGLAVSGLVSSCATGFDKDMAVARERITHWTGQIEVDGQTLEYQEAGSGTPVLFIHGSGAGWDLGPLFTRYWGDGFHFIYPGRFGYLGSTVPKNADNRLQADYYVRLLDHLKIDRVWVVALSYGGPSGIEFALKYPERCLGLVLQSAVSRLTSTRPGSDWFYQWLYASDWNYWWFSSVFKPALLEKFGLSSEVYRRLPARDQLRVDEFLRTFHPAGSRRAGVLADMAMAVSDHDYPFENLRPPLLLIHARDDLLVPFENTQFVLQKRPLTRLVAWDTGGHGLIGHLEDYGQSLREFMGLPTVAAENAQNQEAK